MKTMILVTMFVLSAVAAPETTGGFEPGSHAQMYIDRLIQEIGLDQTKKTEMQKMITRFDQERQGLMEKLKTAVQQLSEASKSAMSNESMIKDKISAVEKAQEKLDDMRTSHHKEMRKFLGTTGYGRYLAFEESAIGEARGKFRQKMTAKPEAPAPAAAAPAVTTNAQPAAPAPAQGTTATQPQNTTAPAK